jgi:hypothetical protein
MASGQAVALWNTYRTLDLQPTGQVVKSSAGEVGGWHLANNSASIRYVKVYNKAAAPTSADTPQLTIPLPANSAANVLAPAGIDFTAGIGLRGTTGIADNDTGAPTANDIVANLFYK